MEGRGEMKEGKKMGGMKGKKGRKGKECMTKRRRKGEGEGE